jgi:hypothetical protein
MSTLDDHKFKERLELLEKEAHRSNLSFDSTGRVSLGSRTQGSAKEEKLKRTLKWYRNLFIALVSFNVIYFGNQIYNFSSVLPVGLTETIYFSDLDVDAAAASLNRYDAGLLARMGAMMEELKL